MQAYILSIAGVVLICAVITVIAPHGKMGKFIKGSMRLFILVVMISPLIGWVQKGELSIATDTQIENDEGYLTHCAAILEEDDENALCEYLEKKFGVSALIEVERVKNAPFERKKIVIILSDEGINGEEGRIYMVARIQEAVEALYGCTTEVL